MTVALLGISFLTPSDLLFVFVVAIPLAALLVRERRARAIRRTFSIGDRPLHTLSVDAIALLLLVALIAVAAAQPVVLRQHPVSERADAQAFFVFDTSLSMDASAGPAAPTRLERAKRLALRLRAVLPDLPIGVVSMTDRTLVHLMPTTDAALFTRTVAQSIAIDRPPPSQTHADRATTFDALVPLAQNNFFAHGVQRRLVVVFTDGEAQPFSQLLLTDPLRQLGLILVHVWAADERIYDRAKGRTADPKYTPDPGSSAALDRLAALTGGDAFEASQYRQIARAARTAVGYARTQTQIDAYARVPLAPWFILAAVLPLAYLIWRRNL